MPAPLGHYEIRSVNAQAVHILLECILVNSDISLLNIKIRLVTSYFVFLHSTPRRSHAFSLSGKNESFSTLIFLSLTERDNPYYFFRTNQQKVDTKIYSLTQSSFTVNECDSHILAGNDKRIKSHCLT